MKKYLLIIAALAVFTTAQAQITTNLPAPLQGVNSSDTNWVVIPYFSYDFTDKKAGGGAAVLYKVTDNFWTGLRAESINGEQTTAGVQAQLQASKTVFGMTLTGFIETSVGMGKSSLYGSVGPGGIVNFYSTDWTWGPGKYALTIGAAADYEHVVNVKNWNQGNIGPMLKISFP